MIGYLVARLVGALAVLAGMSLIVFTLQQIIPADPARAAVGPTAPLTTVQLKRAELGLDQPMLEQFGRYVQRLSRGELGTSTRTHRPVTQDLRQFLPATLELMSFGFLFGVALAVASALFHLSSRIALLLRTLLVALGSAPIFLIGQVLALLLWYRLDWFPGGGRLDAQLIPPDGPTGFLVVDGLLRGRLRICADALHHLALPALTLALPLSAAVGRTLASSIKGVLQQTYIRTARIKGLTDGELLRRHVLRNAAPASLAMLGVQFSIMCTNVMIVESLFGWPGLGFYLVQSYATSDLPAILGVSMTFAALYLSVSVLLDLLQALLDPRIRVL
jgi:peptide/nickel transport system permease protein/dipeptide transport system permease protein